MIKLVELDLSLWLQPEDVEPEAVIYFVDEGERGMIPKPEGEKDIATFEITVKLPNTKNKIWTMNLTSQRAVAKAYGTDTSLWINRPVDVFVTTQNVRGTMKDVIYAKVPNKAPA